MSIYIQTKQLILSIEYGVGWHLLEVPCSFATLCGSCTPVACMNIFMLPSNRNFGTCQHETSLLQVCYTYHLVAWADPLTSGFDHPYSLSEFCRLIYPCGYFTQLCLYIDISVCHKYVLTCYLHKESKCVKVSCYRRSKEKFIQICARKYNVHRRLTMFPIALRALASLIWDSNLDWLSVNLLFEGCLQSMPVTTWVVSLFHN